MPPTPLNTKMDDIWFNPVLYFGTIALLAVMLMLVMRSFLR
jgi:hypothetical protein